MYYYKETGETRKGHWSEEVKRVDGKVFSVEAEKHCKELNVSDSHIHHYIETRYF